mmetsp:Transcript_12525/g.13911  ORF Transcript_12525/g.13911 Transcript_12525/m.13911 type:complete len:297 (+) Transcript_12525:122-1012(+)
MASNNISFTRKNTTFTVSLYDNLTIDAILLLQQYSLVVESDKKAKELTKSRCHTIDQLYDMIGKAANKGSAYSLVTSVDNDVQITITNDGNKLFTLRLKRKIMEEITVLEDKVLKLQRENKALSKKLAQNKWRFSRVHKHKDLALWFDDRCVRLFGHSIWRMIYVNGDFWGGVHHVEYRIDVIGAYMVFGVIPFDFGDANEYTGYHLGEKKLAKGIGLYSSSGKVFSNDTHTPTKIKPFKRCGSVGVTLDMPKKEVKFSVFGVESQGFKLSASCYKFAVCIPSRGDIVTLLEEKCY